MSGKIPSIEKETGEVIITEPVKGKYHIDIVREGQVVTHHQELNEEAFNKLQEVYERKGYTITDNRVIKPEEIEKPRYAPNDYEMLAQDIIEIPYTIKAYEKKMMALTRKNDGIEIRKIEIRSAIYVNVSQEKSEGKNIYSNDKTREAETNRRAAEHMEHKALNEDQENNIKELNDLKNETDFLKRKARSIEILVNLYKIQLRID